MRAKKGVFPITGGSILKDLELNTIMKEDIPTLSLSCYPTKQHLIRYAAGPKGVELVGGMRTWECNAMQKAGHSKI